MLGRRLDRTLSRAAIEYPELVLTGAGILESALVARLRRGPSPRDLQTLLGLGSAREARRLARELRSRYTRHLLTTRMVREGGIEALVPLVRWAEDEALVRAHASGRRSIVVTWHFGPVRALFPGLLRLGIPAVSGAKVFSPRLPEGYESFEVKEDIRSRMRFLDAASRCVKKGGVAVLAADGQNAGNPITVRFLGRRLEVGRGVAALARLLDAAVIPVVASWPSDGPSIELRAYEPLTLPSPSLGAEDWEQAMTEAIAAFFEDEVRRDPAGMHPFMVRRYLDAPPARSSG